MRFETKYVCTGLAHTCTAKDYGKGKCTRCGATILKYQDPVREIQ